MQFQADDPKNLLTEELKAKGITEEQWGDICKTLQDVNRLSNSDFQKAIDGLNSKYFTGVRTSNPAVVHCVHLAGAIAAALCHLSVEALWSRGRHIWVADWLHSCQGRVRQRAEGHDNFHERSMGGQAKIEPVSKLSPCMLRVDLDLWTANHFVVAAEAHRAKMFTFQFTVIGTIKQDITSITRRPCLANQVLAVEPFHHLSLHSRMRSQLRHNARYIP